MNNIRGKYIKDENGNIISPITSDSTIYNDRGMSLESYVPLVYSVNNTVQDNVINIMYNANITDWRMLRITGCIRRDIYNKDRPDDDLAIYLVFNENFAWVSDERFHDLRWMESTFTTYNRIVESNPGRLYIGDIKTPGILTNICVTVNNYTGNPLWKTVESRIKNVAGVQSLFYTSIGGGQFKISNTTFNTINNVQIYCNNNIIRGDLTLEIFKN